MAQGDCEWFDHAGGERVELHEPDPSWSAAAEQWAERITLELAPTVVVVEHIGSTAVPGLVAKPVLDLLVAVPDVDAEGGYRPGLERLGLVLRQREREHRFFRPPADQPRTVHVHVCARDSAWERDYVRFRDVLRSDPARRREYGDLKRRLEAAVGHDRAAYNRGKAAFIASAIISGEE